MAENEPPATPPPADPGTDPAPLNLPTFAPGAPSPGPRAIDLLSDVNLNVKIELGRTRMFVEDVLRLSEGAVVELDKLAGDPVDVYVNDRHVARGEVLVLNDNFCVRINEILAPPSEGAAPVAKAG
jgi:flagellar motor switch protein FliN/FliY